MAVTPSSMRVFGELGAQHEHARLTTAARPSGWPEDSEVADVARVLLAARKRYKSYFPKLVFKDSAWDMILELFVAERERRPVCVKQLMAAALESSTAAMRRIDQLEEIEIIGRSPDPVDHRRVLVRLTERGRLAIKELLCDLGQIRTG